MPKNIGPDRPIWPTAPDQADPSPRPAPTARAPDDATTIHLRQYILLQDGFRSAVRLIAKSAGLH